MTDRPVQEKPREIKTSLRCSSAKMKTSGTSRCSWTTYILVVCAVYLGLLFCVKIGATVTSRGGLLSTTRGDRVVAQPDPLSPISETCKLFPYERYYRATDFEEMRALGRRAEPGDMIELAAGVYSPHRAALESTGGEGVCATWPTRALDGTVFKLHGEPGRVITFCGDKERTIIDGGKGSKKGGAGLQIVRSSYVRFAGFTIRNLLRAVDIQDTSHAEILYITSEKTWHEGFRCVVVVVVVLVVLDLTHSFLTFLLLFCQGEVQFQLQPHSGMH